MPSEINLKNPPQAPSGVEEFALGSLPSRMCVCVCSACGGPENFDTSAVVAFEIRCRVN